MATVQGMCALASSVPGCVTFSLRQSSCQSASAYYLLLLPLAHLRAKRMGCVVPKLLRIIRKTLCSTLHKTLFIPGHSLTRMVRVLH
jgi:hypothetical protein